MEDLIYWIRKNLKEWEEEIITYKEYLQEKKSIMLSYKINYKKYNKIENNIKCI